MIEISTLIWISTAVGLTAFYFFRWARWGSSGFAKVFKWVLILPLGMFLVFWVLVAKNEYHEYQDSQPIKQKGFNDVYLGDSKGDIRFKLGKPDEENTGRFGIGYFYKQRNQQIIFDQKTDRVIMVLNFCVDSTSQIAPKIGNVTCRSSIEQLASVFNKADSFVSTSKDELTRLVSYPSYQVAFGMSKNSVELIAIYDPLFFPEGLKLGVQLEKN